MRFVHQKTGFAGEGAVNSAAVPPRTGPHGDDVASLIEAARVLSTDERVRLVTEIVADLPATDRKAIVGDLIG